MLVRGVRVFVRTVVYLADFIDFGGSRREHQRIMEARERMKWWTDGT